MAKHKAAEDLFDEEPNPDPGGVAGTVDLVPLGGAASIIKASRDSLVTAAQIRPRNLARVLAQSLDELRAFPEFAAKQYYHLEFKMNRAPEAAELQQMLESGKVVMRRDRGGKEQLYQVVEDVGIHGAVALGRNMGNMAVSALVLEDRESDVLIMGVCEDLQTAFVYQSPISVSKFYVKYGTGQLVRWSADRFPLLLGAAASKAARNAILKVVPHQIRIAFLQEAQSINAKLIGLKTAKIDYDKVIPKALDRAGKIGIKQPDIEAYFGKPMRSFTRDDFQALLGLIASVESGERTAAVAFGQQPPQPEPAPQQGAPASGGDPLGGSLVD